MRLKARCNIIGIRKDRDVVPGEIFEPRDEEQGREMIAAGIAEAIHEPAGETPRKAVKAKGGK